MRAPAISNAELYRVFTAIRPLTLGRYPTLHGSNTIKAVLRQSKLRGQMTGGFAEQKLIWAVRVLSDKGALASDRLAAQLFPHFFRGGPPAAGAPSGNGPPPEDGIGDSEGEEPAAPPKPTDQDWLQSRLRNSKWRMIYSVYHHVWPAIAENPPDAPELAVLDNMAPFCLPYAAQHAILSTTQRALEERCFALAQRRMPQLLAQRGLDCAIALDLRTWLAVLHEDDATAARLQKSLHTIDARGDAFADMARLRNAAAHRSPLSAEGVGQILDSAARLAEFFRDAKLHAQLMRVREVLRQGVPAMFERRKSLGNKLLNIRKLHKAFGVKEMYLMRVRKELRQVGRATFERRELENTLLNITRLHNALDVKKRNLIQEVIGREAEDKVIVGQQLETVLLDAFKGGGHAAAQDAGPAEGGGDGGPGPEQPAPALAQSESPAPPDTLEPSGPPDTPVSWGQGPPPPQAPQPPNLETHTHTTSLPPHRMSPAGPPKTWVESKGRPDPPKAGVESKGRPRDPLKPGVDSKGRRRRPCTTAGKDNSPNAHMSFSDLLTEQSVAILGQEKRDTTTPSAEADDARPRKGDSPKRADDRSNEPSKTPALEKRSGAAGDKRDTTTRSAEAGGARPREGGSSKLVDDRPKEPPKTPTLEKRSGAGDPSKRADDRLKEPPKTPTLEKRSGAAGDDKMRAKKYEKPPHATLTQMFPAGPRRPPPHTNPGTQVFRANLRRLALGLATPYHVKMPPSTRASAPPASDTPSKYPLKKAGAPPAPAPAAGDTPYKYPLKKLPPAPAPPPPAESTPIQAPGEAAARVIARLTRRGNNP